MLGQQLGALSAAGFGGVEVQPLLLGFGRDDLAADARLRSVGDPAFFARLGEASFMAAERGLAFDLTLGSGWPGGLPTSPEKAESELLMATLDLPGPGEFVGPLPPPPEQAYRGAVEWALDVLGPPDAAASLVVVLAGRLGAERDGVPSLEEVRLITDQVQDDRLRWLVPPGSWRIFAFYRHGTGHFVMGGAYPGGEAEALVVDHLSRDGADALIEGYGDPALEAIGQGRVRGVFVDSFELMGELPFSSGFLPAFQAFAGYDLTPHLPLVFRRGGESKYAEMMDVFGRSGGPLYLSPELGRGQRIREDYEAVRRRLFEQNFVGRFAEWAKARGVSFRLQAHGGYADYLDTYALADVPESEGLFAGGGFDFLKLASSAAHVGGRKWASSEAFITMRLFGTGLSWEEMDLLAGRAYSAGINRLVFHGVPYPYTRADGEGWYPFSGGFGRILAGPFPMSLEVNEELLGGLPDFNRFLGRLSVAMSQGDPVAEVAWLRADPSFPDEASFEWGRVDPREGESETSRALRARGLGYDRVSRAMLSGAQLGVGEFSVGSASYRALLLDPVTVAEPELVARILELSRAGIPVVALGALPGRAPGLRDAEARDAAVHRASEALAPRVLRVGKGASLEDLLAENVKGGLVEPLPGAALSVSLARRHTETGDIVLVFNESWSGTKADLRFNRGGGPLLAWDPRHGGRTLLRERVKAGEAVSLDLPGPGLLILTMGAQGQTQEGKLSTRAAMGPRGMETSRCHQEAEEERGEDQVAHRADEGQDAHCVLGEGSDPKKGDTGLPQGGDEDESVILAGIPGDEPVAETE